MFKKGAAITTKVLNHNFFQLIVIVEVGDYISVGS